MFCFLMLYIGLFLGGVLKTVSTDICPPAEEGKAYSIQKQFEHKLDENVEILMKKNSGTPVSQCRNNLSCQDLNTSTTTTTITSLGNRVYLVNFTIKTMSRSDSGLWEIKYLGLASLKNSSPLFSCQLVSFVKAKNITCNENFEGKTIMKIYCEVCGIYPSARGLLFSKSSESRNIMVCTDNQTETSPVYYMSVCQFSVPVKDMPSILDNPFVSIYPNITDKEDDIRYSVNFTMGDYRAQPVVVLQNCPDVIEEWAQVKCLCRPRDNSPMQTNVSWMSNSDNKFSTNSNWLHFQAQIKHTEYVCQGRSLAGLSSEPVIYRPTVYSGVKNITCSVEKISSDFVIRCYIYKVYPPAICTILKYNEHFAGELIAVNTSHVQLSNEVYYNTECTWKIPISHLQLSKSNVSVKVYPNISGSEKDMDYVFVKTLQLNKESSQESSHEGSLIPHEYVGPIAVAAASLLVLIFAAILFIIIVRRKNLSPRPPLEPMSRIPKQSDIDGIYATIDEIPLYVNHTVIHEQTNLLNDYITVVDVNTFPKIRNISDESDGYFSQEESATSKL